MELLEVNHRQDLRRRRELLSALKGVSFSVPKGEYMAVVQRIGSGKNTCCGVDQPDWIPTLPARC